MKFPWEGFLMQRLSCWWRTGHHWKIVEMCFVCPAFVEQCELCGAMKGSGCGVS